MKQHFYLPGLNFHNAQQKNPSTHFVKYFHGVKDSYPKLFSFVDDTNVFFRDNFGEFNEYKLREKRLLDFETPNRAKITHEYDMDLGADFDFSQCYYLFNPASRLSWLKIKCENHRIVIAKEDQVKEVIRSLSDFSIELKRIHLAYDASKPPRILDEDEVFDELWQLKSGHPCFIRLEKGDETKFILEVEYWDSIKAEKRNRGCIFSPIEERMISYEYFPLQKASSWLYIRAPRHFEVTVSTGSCNSLINEIDNSGSEIESDPEIKSLTIRNSGSNVQTADYVVTFNIQILVPKTLKLWYVIIYWSTMVLTSLLFAGIVNRILLCAGVSIYDKDILDSIIAYKDFNNVVLAVVAAIIATRGWLIVEETILKRYSIILTIMMVMLIVFTITYSLI